LKPFLGTYQEATCLPKSLPHARHLRAQCGVGSHALSDFLQSVTNCACLPPATGCSQLALDGLQAGDQGWSDNGQVGALGSTQLELTGMQTGRKVQAWLYDSLNKGLLAGRIQALMLMTDLLEDWYFSWALLRTEGALQDVLMELVKVSYSHPSCRFVSALCIPACPRWQVSPGI
jgi:hypothetical protein